MASCYLDANVLVSYVSKHNTFHQQAPRDAYHLMTAKIHGADYFATFDNDFKKVFEAGEIDEF